MPGSVNVPFDAVLDCGRFKSPDAIREVFRAAGIEPEATAEAQTGRPLVLSCGTGVTACVLRLALQVAAPGIEAAVYDGSWTEWGGLDSTPIANPAAGGGAS